MPAFNLAGALNSNAQKQYGFLVDALAIKQNRLESDGKLSPGDYDSLIADARKLYSNPLFSSAERSNIAVKISQYEQAKSTTSLAKLNDIARLDREVKDTHAQNVMFLGNNPERFLQSNVDTLRAKIDQLSRSIDSLSASGDDPSSHLNEFNSALSDYQDALQALDDVKKSSGSAAPTSNFAAYLTTNAQGEIVNADIGRVGSKSGYAETNALYGGLQVYAKINRKDANGNNVFQIGNQTFSAPDVVVPDPMNPGSYKTGRLVSTAQQSHGGVGFDVAQSGKFEPIDFAGVRTQSSIRSGGWAEGSKGFLYQRQDNGSYVKYVNADKKKLGISENDIIRIPSSLESSIASQSTQTIDASKQIEFPSGTPGVSAGAPSQPVIPQSPQQPAGTPRTPSPTTSSPGGALDYASQTLQKAGGFLKSLFGR